MAAQLGFEGFVLAGGGSTRFGTDKALIEHKGKTLLEHSLAVMRELGVEPRVVARTIDPYRPYARAFVSSERPGMGPAEAMRAVLRACTAPWALVLSTDMPGVTASAVRVLLREIETGGEFSTVCFRDASKRLHPFPGIYAKHLLSRLEGVESMHGVLDLGNRPVGEPAGTGKLDRILLNVNRPEDLERRV